MSNKLSATAPANLWGRIADWEQGLATGATPVLRRATSLGGPMSRSWAKTWFVRFRALLTDRALLSGVLALALLHTLSAHAQPPVLQRGYDASVSGATLSETTLNASNVAPSTFGLVFKLPVDDNIMAQPLYVPNVVINQITHNVLYVATM